MKGLSCLKGNFHEQFLGGLAGAIPPGYPAHEETYGNATRLVPTQRNIHHDIPCLRCRLINPETQSIMGKYGPQAHSSHM